MLSLSGFTAVDGTPQIPFMSIFCMGTTLLIAVVPLIFVIVSAKKKLQGSLVPILYGMVCYVVFDFIFLSFIMSAWQNVDAIKENGPVFALIEALFTGFLGILGRTVLMMAVAKSKFILKGNSIGSAIIAGAGYMLYRALLIIIIIGQRFIMALTINMFGIGNLVVDAKEEDVEGLAVIYENFLTTPSYTFLIEGIRFIMMLAVSISLAIIIYAVYNKKAHRMLIGFALFLNILFELPFCLNYYGILLKNYFAAILITALFTIWIGILAYKTMNVSLKEEIKAKEAEIKESKHKAFPDFNANIKK